MEVTLGNMALQKTTHNGLKRFAERIVHEHSKASQELLTLAMNKNFKVDPTILLPKYQRHVDRRNAVRTTEFDRAFMQYMVEAHKDDIDECEDAATKAKNKAARNFAARHLPHLRRHRDTAEATRKGLKSNFIPGNKGF